MNNCQATVTVELGARSYNIFIGEGLLANSGAITKYLGMSRAALVTNPTIWTLYGKELANRLTAVGAEIVTVILPDGEAHKSAASLATIYDALLENRCDRSTTIIALGGGVIGDLAGFAAATYQRGVPVLQVPTTLLAMVDSSVGGKTAINHPLGKNMIGAFHQPKCVVADIRTLATLPAREYQSALAEVVKYGLIADPQFLDWLESNVERINSRDPDALVHMIAKSCTIKANIVAADERETAVDGGRENLNLGHTFGHALESVLGYGQWLHGEAVACGIVLATQFAESLGKVSSLQSARVMALLQAFQLPVTPPALASSEILDFMRRDKKNKDGAIRLILPVGIGRTETCSIAAPDLMRFLEGRFAPGPRPSTDTDGKELSW